MDDARAAMARLAENMDAMKCNFLLRGFFKRAGGLRPRPDVAGELPEGRPHQGQRSPSRPRLAARGRAIRAAARSSGRRAARQPGQDGIDSAIAPYLENIASGVVMVEGYAQQSTRDEQYLRSQCARRWSVTT